jgi:hypothetical protein
LRRLRRDALAREAIIGLVLAIIGVLAAWSIADRQDRLARDLETAAEIQEDVRFVRQVAIDNETIKPFAGLNLSDAALGGLDLGCYTVPEIGEASYHPRRIESCAEFSDADLSGADLSNTRLSGARFVDADLADADLSSDLYALLSRPGPPEVLRQVIGTDLRYADLTRANLRSADLSLSIWRGPSFSAATCPAPTYGAPT